ncbi:MAG: ATP synthase F1 subunit delta [Thermoanaerobaculia bacterium]
MAANFTKPYVDALFEVLGSADTVQEQLPTLDAFAALLSGNAELRMVLRNPGIDRTRKGAIVQQLATQAGASPIALRLLNTLLINQRIPALAELTKAIRLRLDRERRVVEATVRSASPLSPETEAEIRAALEKRSKMNVRIKPIVDPALLAGFVVQIGSEIYDTSLAQRLARTKLALHGAGAAH